MIFDRQTSTKMQAKSNVIKMSNVQTDQGHKNWGY